MYLVPHRPPIKPGALGAPVRINEKARVATQIEINGKQRPPSIGFMRLALSDQSLKDIQRIVSYGLVHNIVDPRRYENVKNIRNDQEGVDNRVIILQILLAEDREVLWKLYQLIDNLTSRGNRMHKFMHHDKHLYDFKDPSFADLQEWTDVKPSPITRQVPVTGPQPHHLPQPAASGTITSGTRSMVAVSPDADTVTTYQNTVPSNDKRGGGGSLPTELSGITQEDSVARSTSPKHLIGGTENTDGPAEKYLSWRLPMFLASVDEKDEHVYLNRPNRQWQGTVEKVEPLGTFPLCGETHTNYMARTAKERGLLATDWQPLRQDIATARCCLCSVSRETIDWALKKKRESWYTLVVDEREENKNLQKYYHQKTRNRQDLATVVHGWEKK